MRKYLLINSLLISLAACGQKSHIEDAIRDRMRDPASAQFKNMVISDPGNFACVIYNGKNGFGGMGSWSIAELRKEDSKWTATSMEGSSENCTPQKLKSKEELRSLYESVKKIGG